ncbi:MAG TPA: hypothetical protein VFS87_03945 [Qipengyuania sp.]|nr:hypothetical protein [Qipengyuania sp.]
MSKEARRQEDARKKRRNAKIAKSTVIGACVIVMPILAYLALRV